jgi:hypothetical protein
MFATTWVAAAAGIWVVAVSAWILFTSFCWVDAAAPTLGTILVTSVRSARPTPSIAGVLYEAEHRMDPS